MARNPISRACNGYARIHKYIVYIINRRKEEIKKGIGKEERRIESLEKEKRREEKRGLQHSSNGVYGMHKQHNGKI